MEEEAWRERGLGASHPLCGKKRSAATGDSSCVAFGRFLPYSYISTVLRPSERRELRGGKKTINPLNPEARAT